VLHIALCCKNVHGVTKLLGQETSGFKYVQLNK